MSAPPAGRPAAGGTWPIVLCIAGSPRRGGNSDHLLDACIDGIRKSGGTPKKLVVATAGIAPCRGCNSCSKTGRCAVHDGMTDVYPLIDEADAFVIATPVFFATVPAVLKALYDRCQPYWARRYILGQPLARRRAGAILVAGGGGDPYGAGCAVTATKSVFAVLGVDCVAELVVEGVDRPRDVIGHPEALLKAEEAGAEVVAEARLLGF